MPTLDVDTQGLRDVIINGMSRAQRPGDRDLRDLIVTWMSRAQRQGDIASYLFHALQTLSFWLVVQAEGNSPRGLQLWRETAKRLGGITNAFLMFSSEIIRPIFWTRPLHSSRDFQLMHFRKSLVCKPLGV